MFIAKTHRHNIKAIGIYYNTIYIIRYTAREKPALTDWMIYAAKQQDPEGFEVRFVNSLIGV